MCGVSLYVILWTKENYLWLENYLLIKSRQHLKTFSTFFREKKGLGVSLKWSTSRKWDSISRRQFEWNVKCYFLNHISLLLTWQFSWQSDKALNADRWVGRHDNGMACAVCVWHKAVFAHVSNIKINGTRTCSFLTLSVPNFRRHLSTAFFLSKLSRGKKFICKAERLNPKQHGSWWDGSSSGSTLFANNYYYRLWQWKS